MIRIFAWVLALAGCAATPQLATTAPPLPTMITQKCVRESEIPVLPPTAATPRGTHRQNAAAAAVDADEARRVAGEAIILLRNCVAD